MTIWAFGVNFIARTGVFGRDVGRARSVMNSFHSSVIGVQATLRRYARTLLATAGIYGIGYMIKQQMEAVHEAGELGKRIGMTTEALSAMQYAAKMSGVEQEVLNNSLEKYNRTLGESQAKSDSARAAFARIGLSFRDLVSLNADEQIGLIADQINKLGTQSQKSAAMQTIFGRGSQTLLNLLSEGSQGIAAYREEAKKLGLVFDEIDAAKADAAVRALSKLKFVFTGIFREGVIQLAPYIEAGANAFTDWATAGEGVGNRVALIFESVTLSIVKTGEEVELLIMKFNQLSSPLDYLKKLNEANKKAIEQYRSITGDTKAFTSPLGPLGATTQPLDPYMFEAIQNVQKQAAGIEPKSRESEIRTSFNRFRANAESRAKAIMEARDKTSGTPIISEQQRETQWSQYLEKLRDDMDNWSLYVEDRWGDTASSIEGSTGNMFASMIKSGGDWRDAMSNYFNDIASAASQMAGQTTARALFGSIFTAGAGAAAGAAGGNMAPSPEGGMMPVNYHEGGIIGEGGGIRRSMPASAFAMAPRFHSGLRADEFTAILERGEKVIPKGGGRGGMTINVQSPDVTATQRWLWQNRHALADMMGSAGRENNKIRRSQG